MSSSAVPPLPSPSADHQHPRALPPMSFRSSSSSKASTLGPAARVDLPMRPAIGGGGGISTSGYYADVMGTLGSSWISRLRRPSPQPPPAQAAQTTSPSVATAGTEGSGVTGGERVSAGPAEGPFLNPAHHVQRLCLSPLGLDDNLHRNARQQQPATRQVTADRVRGFGPFRFSDVRDQDPVDGGVKGNRPVVVPPDRAPPQRTATPIPNPWTLPSDAGSATNPRLRPSGFFPLFSKMVSAGEEALGSPIKPSSPPPCTAESSGDVKPPVLLIRPQQGHHPRAFGAGDDPFSSEDHLRLSPHPYPSSTRVLPPLQLTNTSATGGSATVRLVDLNPLASSSQSLTDAVFPTADGGGGRRKGLPAFGPSPSRGPVATTSKASACLPADPWRSTNAVPLLTGNAEDHPQTGRQFLNKDHATAIAINRKPLASSRLAPAVAAACGSKDRRFLFWNMGRFWPSTGAASESLSRKRLHAPDSAVASPLKCRKLDNQG